MLNDDSIEIYLCNMLRFKIISYYKMMEDKEERIKINHLKENHLMSLNDGIIYEDDLLMFYKEDSKILIAMQEKLFKTEKNNVLNKFGPILFDKIFYDSLLNRDDFFGVLDDVTIPKEIVEYVPKQKILERFHHYDGRITETRYEK